MTTVSNCGNKNGPNNLSSNTIVSTGGNPKRYLLPQKFALNKPMSGSSTVTGGNGLRIIKKKVSVSNMDLEEFLKNQTLPTEVSRQIHRDNSATGIMTDQTTV